MTTSTSDHRAFREVARFGSLDGLRAISIIGVVWHHGAGSQASVPLLQGGFLGVQLFFAISGFLITTLLIRERDARGQISLRKFYARRALRIFPLYYSVLVLYVVLVGRLMADTATGRQFFANLPYFATYTSNWFVGAMPGVTFSYAWSLATEEQFYSTWPWCERYLTGRWRVAALVGLCLLGILATVGMLSSVFPRGNLAGAMVASISLPVCLGVALAHTMHTPTGFKALAPAIGQRWSSVTWMALLLIGIQAGMPLVVIAFLMTFLVGACIAREDHALARMLGWGPLVRLGVVSYGVYLFHGLIYNALGWLAGRVGAIEWHKSTLEFVVVLLATFAVAELSFRYYESLFLRAKKRYAA